MTTESRIALVTGGTRGIGKAIAQRLLDDGYAVTITGTDESSKSRDMAQFGFLQGDFSRGEDLEKIVTIIRQMQPDVLINNVGINIKGDTVDFSALDLDKTMQINLTAPFKLIQAVLPAMLDRGWGRIVNITSLWGISGNPKDAAYCASKFGLDGLTVSIAGEVASKGILINAVAPGFVMTEQVAEAYTPKEIEDVGKKIPIGRMAQPSEIASLVSWLASEQNSYVTGQNILVDGGLTRTFIS